MEQLQFKLDGPAFDEGVPLHSAVMALSNFQAIVDKTYLVLTNGKRLSHSDRELFHLRALEFRRGSFLTNFEIAMAAVQLTLPFVTELGPQNIWEYTKDTFNFLKLVFTSAQEGQRPTYNFENNGDVAVHIGDNHYHFHGPVYQIGERSLPNYRNLAHMMQPGKIESIFAGTSETRDIYLETKDRELFDVPSVIDNSPIEIECEIFDFNKFNNIGKLLVKEGQTIPSGEYNFTIIGSQNTVDYIYSMLKPRVSISCLKEMKINPFGESNIYRLHVLGVVS